MIKIVVIGAGPAGIVASICLKKRLNKQAEVILIEKMNKIGKKILASGNGKCNISNAQISNKDVYNNDLAKHIFKKYSSIDLENELLEYGIILKEDSSHRIYPITESSQTVLEMLNIQLKKYHVKVYENNEVIHVKQDKNQKYHIYTNDKRYNYFICDYLIFATGGKASPKLGSNGSGYQLLSKMNILTTSLKPGLVGLKVKDKDIVGLDGLRKKAKVYLYDKENEVFMEDGEIQFKKDGISGIVIMNASSIIARSNKLLKLKIDFLPSMNIENIEKILNNIKTNNKNILFRQLTHGILPKPLADKICNDLQQENNLSIHSFASRAKNYFIDVIGDYGFESAQVTVGGIKLAEINDTFELKKYKNTYAIGEVLDVDGLCGGYNMHFAIASGIIVANTIFEKERNSYEKEK